MTTNLGKNLSCIVLLAGALLVCARPARACEGDLDGDRVVTVDELVRAVLSALNGCTDTPTPTAGPALADLLPTGTRDLHCAAGGGCAPHRIEICIANQGEADADPFTVQVNGRPVETLAGLSAATDVCIETVYHSFDAEDMASVTVDGEDSVAESDEENNTLFFPAPNPTECDVVCTPAPVRTPQPPRPDLVPTSSRSLPCPGGCGPQRVEICVANEGEVDSGSFDVSVNNEWVREVPLLDAGAEICLSVRYPFADMPEIASLTVDAGDLVAETNESNNELLFPAPNPTACDVPCVPTPIATPNPAL